MKNIYNYKQFINENIYKGYVSTSTYDNIKISDDKPSRELLDKKELKELNNKLLDYSKKGDLSGVKQSIKNGADVNCKDIVDWTPLHWTPLHWSSYNGHLNVVKYLIEQGADVNCKNNDGWTPLHRSSQEGNLDIIKYLIENGADVNCKNNYGDTPLYWSSYNDNLNIVKYLIEHGTDWFIKNDNNEYFIDYLSDKNKNIIKKLYPDKYKEFQMRIEMDKYNL